MFKDFLTLTVYCLILPLVAVFILERLLHFKYKKTKKKMNAYMPGNYYSDDLLEHFDYQAYHEQDERLCPTHNRKAKLSLKRCHKCLCRCGECEC